MQSSRLSWGLLQGKVLLMAVLMMTLLPLGDALWAAEERAAIIRPEELKRGQKGYGISVFAGHTTERFEAEVLGVVHQSTPELSYIIARLSGQDLERSGVAAGMSGSPVYFDGRLAGAVSYGYLFGKDAIAGITPIEGMRAISALPSVDDATTPARLDVAAWLAPTWDEMVERSFSAEMLSEALEQVLGGDSGTSLQESRPAITWTASGFTEPARRLLAGSIGGALAPTLGGLTAAVGDSSHGEGGHGLTEVPELAAGSGMAVVLVDGDLRLAAHGTVTERWGQEILGFGHPLYGFGPLRLPLASSEVITIIASVANSFKLSNAGPIVGVLDQDREAGVRGQIGVMPVLTDLRIHTRGQVDRDYNLRVAQLPQLRPLLIATSVLGALESSDRSSGRLGLDMVTLFDLGEDGELRIEQSFDGSDAALEAATSLLAYGAFLDLNAWKELDLRSVDVTLEQVEISRNDTLVSAQPAARRIQPGQRLPVVLEFEAWRGERFRRTIEVDIPPTAPAGPYWLMLGDGTSVDALRLAIEKSEPQTFEASLAALRGLRSRRQLSVLGMRAAPGLSLGGEALPALPTSLRQLFGQGQTTEHKDLRLVIDHEQHEALDRPIDGALRIDLEVQMRRP